MSHARVEELSSSEDDPSEDDISAYASPSPPTAGSPTISSLRAPPPQSRAPPPPNAQQQPFNTAPPPDYKSYSCLYPLYFDASRTRAEGRRVQKDLAVENPLARTVVDAVQSLGLKSVFEPGKTHPRDWGNVGRVRVEITPTSSRVKNKHHLYILVAKYLQSHPTTKETPLMLRIQGVPVPEGGVKEPAVPKGWKVNRILPLHSPAVSGGGVSENILGDMMKEVQAAGGQGGGGIPGMVEQGGSGGGGGGGGGAGQGKRKREGGKKK